MKKKYLNPEIDCVRVNVEKGFALTTEVSPWGPGGNDSGEAE